MIEFVLKFRSKFAETPPHFTVLHDTNIVYGETTVADQHIATFQIEDLKEGTHVIQVLRTNHDQITDQLLTLESITADDIDLAKVLSHCKYYPKYPEPWFSEQKEAGVEWPEYFSGSLDWGWNGNWTLVYKAPFYTWLLENV